MKENKNKTRKGKTVNHKNNNVTFSQQKKKVEVRFRVVDLDRPGGRQGGTFWYIFFPAPKYSE